MQKLYIKHLDKSIVISDFKMVFSTRDDCVTLSFFKRDFDDIDGGESDKYNFDVIYITEDGHGDGCLFEGMYKVDRSDTFMWITYIKENDIVDDPDWVRVIQREESLNKILEE